MAGFTLPPALQIMGWLATATMTATVVAMILVVAAMIKAAAAAILLAAVWPNMTAAADEPSAGAPAPPPPSADPTKLLLGDIGGLRSELTKRGIIPAVTEIEEFLGNVSGGVRQA